jgi:hypothetical protein
MTTARAVRQVDQSALKVNQAFVMGLLILAFVLDSSLLVVFVALVMLVGTAIPALALFQIVYRRALKPARLVRPNIIVDNPEPHRFAQGFGGVVVTLGLASLLAGQAVLGWALVWLVVGLAAANFFLGFCAGCFLYYQFSRLGVPGFRPSPLR